MYGESCRWWLRETYLQRHDKFEITQYDGDHSCVYSRLSQDHSRLDSDLIASELASVVKKNPSVNVRTLQDMILKKYGYNVNYWKVWNGRRKSIIKIYGDWIESYNLLPTWTNVMQMTNPGLIVLWRLSEVQGNDGLSIFHSVFWSFGPVIEGFKSCRPLLQIDGTHLYGKYKGKLLIATFVDANSHIYPVAFTIVPEESAYTWGWFLNNIWNHVVHKRNNMCLISDIHKGIISAVRNLTNGWEDAHHRFCLRHLASNFNERYKNIKLKKIVYRAGSQYRIQKFEECMDELRRANANCMRFFTGLDLKQWAQADDGGHRYRWVTTNVTECINGVLKGARKLLITALVQSTFYRTVSYFALRRVEIEAAIERGERFTRYAVDKLTPREERANRHEFNIFDRRTGLCEVTTSIDPVNSKGGTTHRVKLSERTCMCNKWQSYGIPCSHAIAACKSIGIDYLQFIQPYYELSTYLSCYSPQFETIPDKKCWPKCHDPSRTISTDP